MGAHSTLYLTREKALGLFLNLSVNMTDEQLESALDRLLDDRLYRVSIRDPENAIDDEYAGSLLR